MIKKTIYILHGWAQDPDNENKWAELRSQLAVYGYQTVFLPLPGLTTPLDEVWTLDSYASWLEEQLADEKKIILLGHSFGGQIAVRFTAQNGEKVTKLILIDSAGILDKSLFVLLKKNIFYYLAKIGKLFFSAEIFRKALYFLVREKDYYQASQTLRQTMSNVVREEVEQELSQIQTPTLILWGAKDSITPVKLAKKFKDNLKNSQLKIIDEARHSPQFTHAKLVAQEIAEFIQ